MPLLIPFNNIIKRSLSQSSAFAQSLVFHFLVKVLEEWGNMRSSEKLHSVRLHSLTYCISSLIITVSFNSILTISEVLSEEKTVAVQAVIDERQVFELVNDLRNAGARDILVVPIERII